MVSYGSEDIFSIFVQYFHVLVAAREDAIHLLSTAAHDRGHTNQKRGLVGAMSERNMLAYHVYGILELCEASKTCKKGITTSAAFQ